MSIEHGRTPAIGYLRVSTIEQLDGGGLDVQRDTVTVYAAAHGLTIVAWEVDEGASGALEDRIGLVCAIDRLKVGEAGIIVIPKLDRLSRDLMLQESVLRDVWRLGGTVLSCVDSETQFMQPDDPTDPTRKFIRQVLGAAAEWERAMIRARMVAGRRRKIMHKGWAGGPVPFGFVLDYEGGLVPDEAEAEVVRYIASLQADGAGAPKIAAWLNEQGIASRSGNPWTKGAVWRVLQSWEKYRPKEAVA